MDPLSTIASVIALVEAASHVSEAISRLRHYGELPRKIYALKNEVKDLGIVLHEISVTLKQKPLTDDEAYGSLGPMLTRTKNSLENLIHALERLADAFSGSKLKAMSKSAIWFKEKETFQGFRDDIGSIKSTLTVLLSATISHNVQHIILEFREFAVSKSNHGEFNHSIQEVTDDNLAPSSFMNKQEVVNSHINTLSKILPPQSPENTSRLLLDETLVLSKKAADTQMLRIKSTQGSTCQTWCPCICHKKRKSNLTTPGAVQGVLGRMFVGYSGVPLFKERCDFRACHHQNNTSATIEFWFPSWLVSMNLKFSFTYLPNIGPEFLLSTTTRVADDSQSITFAMEGNVDGLKHLFENRLAGPRDVSDSRGYTLMRWALYGGMHNYEMVKFLVDRGALVDETSYDNVWDFIMRGKCTETQQSQLRCITDAKREDWIEEQNFPLIHRIVFGLSSKSLEAELEENPLAVSITDSQNRSALDWATARAQLEDMATLMRYGADPNNMDVTGRTTVLHAVDSHDIRGLRLILNAGGNPNPTYPKGMFRSSPLTAAGFAGMPELLKLLLDSEADPNACNPEGLTALHSVARTHNTECALLLLEYGADLNAMSSHGRTPLTTAIMHNNYPVLQLFTDRCWDYMTVPQFNVPEILPVIVEYADVKTIRILASVHPVKLSYDVSFDSLAANQRVLEQRSDYDEELGEAFDTLMAAAKAGAEELKSPDSILESGFYSARSSFHSEIASAVLKLRSIDVSPTDSYSADTEKWRNWEEAFDSPISLTTRHAFASPVSPTFGESIVLNTPAARNQLRCPVTISSLRKQKSRQDMGGTCDT